MYIRHTIPSDLKQTKSLAQMHKQFSQKQEKNQKKESLDRCKVGVQTSKYIEQQ